ncbi:hypothetical protein R1sor_013388 [Riccia sorocarpa]|uniref:Uncharacterized protein n=1 Tax=Riccia sorocarpa TaxID=122646 RepID=A0ABD3HCK6_9MARC
MPFDLTHSQEINDADDVQYQHHEEGDRHEIEPNGDKQNVPTEQVESTTDLEGIDINDLDIVDLQTMVPPDMDSQLLTNDFLQMGYAVRRPRTDHILDVDPKLRIRRILKLKHKHDQQTSKAPDLTSQASSKDNISTTSGASLLS